MNLKDKVTRLIDSMLECIHKEKLEQLRLNKLQECQALALNLRYLMVQVFKNCSSPVMGLSKIAYDNDIRCLSVALTDKDRYVMITYNFHKSESHEFIQMVLDQMRDELYKTMHFGIEEIVLRGDRYLFPVLNKQFRILRVEDVGLSVNVLIAIKL